MKPGEIRQGALGILAALLSIALVIGSLSMSIAEAGTLLSLAPSASPTVSPTLQPSATQTVSTLPATSMVTPATPFTPSPTASITPVPTLPPPPTNCPPPDGWSPITVQSGDNLESLARTYQTTSRLLAQANCLIVDSLLPGTTLYVPTQPTPPAPTECGPPTGWVYYVVQPGDTLFSLSLNYGVTIAQLQEANCLGSSTYIRSGQRLFVPFLLALTQTPTLTRTSTPLLSATPTPPYTPTATVFVPPATPTRTPTATATGVITVTPTHTSVPTATPTNTDVPTSTPTHTDVPTPTPTHTDVPTYTPTATTAAGTG